MGGSPPRSVVALGRGGGSRFRDYLFVAPLVLGVNVVAGADADLAALGPDATASDSRGGAGETDHVSPSGGDWLMAHARFAITDGGCVLSPVTDGGALCLGEQHCEGALDSSDPAGGLPEARTGTGRAAAVADVSRACGVPAPKPQNPSRVEINIFNLYF